MFTDYATFYSSIILPVYAPPAWVFGVAWGIIYPLIAIAFAIVLVQFARRRISSGIILAFLANIVANILFTPILLQYGGIGWALLDLLVVLGTLIYLEVKLYWQSLSAFLVLLPYLVWVAFATFLQLSIFWIN